MERIFFGVSHDKEKKSSFLSKVAHNALFSNLKIHLKFRTIRKIQIKAIFNTVQYDIYATKKGMNFVRSLLFL